MANRERHPTTGPHAIAPAMAPSFGPSWGPPSPDPEARAAAARRYHTPTGEPCPRTVGVDGTVEGGDCSCCGFCLLLAGLV
jgi:hypothetical protein